MRVNRKENQERSEHRLSGFGKEKSRISEQVPKNYLFLCLFISHTSLKGLQLLTEGMFYSKQNFNKFNFSSFVVENKFWNITKEVYTKLYF